VNAGEQDAQKRRQMQQLQGILAETEGASNFCKSLANKENIVAD
jgi:hypothetical protein